MSVNTDLPSRSLIVGISGFGHSAAAALYLPQALEAACQQERLTRVRGVGVEAGGFPRDALKAALRSVGRDEGDVTETVIAEPALQAFVRPGAHQLDHHRGHAATAFLTSPFREATIVVCDSDTEREVSVWRGYGSTLEAVEVDWRGPGFASVYSRLTRLLGFGPRSESLVEALARVHPEGDPGRAEQLLTYAGGALSVAPGFVEYVEHARGAALSEQSRVAASIQRQMAKLILEFLQDSVPANKGTNLCLGGGLFYNTYFNSTVRQSALFRSVYVPVNPGNGGVAAGCALARGCERHGRDDRPQTVSPFLGPEYSNAEIKSVLDNCKLTYAFLGDAQLVQRAVETLARGQLVGWFQGRLEWGRRSLGNRSIFANPVAPYALENLNAFLKRRAAHRTYGLVARQEDVQALFDGPTTSPFMECEFTLTDPERFRSILPPRTNRLQVQTVAHENPRLRQLLTEFDQLTGVPVLVNTSFNGLQEPIVCSPRDAVRVFFGSGLDMAVIGNFLLRK